MFWAILDHHIGQLVIHIRLDTRRGITLLGRFLTDDFRAYRTSSRECLHHGLSLELNQSFGEERVVYAARTRPRLGPVFDLHTKQFETIDIGLYPVLAARQVFLKFTEQVASKLCEHALIHVFGQVIVEPVVFLGVRVDLDLHIAGADCYLFGVLNLDFKRRLLAHHIFVGKAKWRSVKGFIDIHLLTLLCCGFHHRLGY